MGRKHLPRPKCSIESMRQVLMSTGIAAAVLSLGAAPAGAEELWPASYTGKHSPQIQAAAIPEAEG